MNIPNYNFENSNASRNILGAEVNKDSFSSIFLYPILALDFFYLKTAMISVWGIFQERYFAWFGLSKVIFQHSLTEIGKIFMTWSSQAVPTGGYYSQPFPKKCVGLNSLTYGSMKKFCVCTLYFDRKLLYSL